MNNLFQRFFVEKGDEKYGVGVPEELRTFLRKKSDLFLHSYQLELIHPVTKENLKFTAPLPNHFRQLMNSLDYEKKLFIENSRIYNPIKPDKKKEKKVVEKPKKRMRRSNKFALKNMKSTRIKDKK